MIERWPSARRRASTFSIACAAPVNLCSTKVLSKGLTRRPKTLSPVSRSSGVASCSGSRAKCTPGPECSPRLHAFISEIPDGTTSSVGFRDQSVGAKDLKLTLRRAPCRGSVYPSFQVDVNAMAGRPLRGRQCRIRGGFMAAASTTGV